MFKAWIELLQQAWQGSLAQQFFRWWGAELWGMLPSSLQRLWRKPCPPVELSELATQPAGQVLAVIPAEQILVQSLTVPVRSLSKARAVIGYQIDQYTPFAPDEVCFDLALKQRTAEGLELWLVAISQEHLGRLRQQWQSLAITVKGLDVSIDKKTLGVDLLRATQPPQNHWIRGGLAVSMVLIIVLWAQWYSGTQQQLEAMRQEVRQQQTQVSQLLKARQKVLQQAKARTQLLRVRTAHLPVAVLLAKVSDCMPDDSWLSSFSLEKDDQLMLSGQASQPAELLSALRQCDALTEAKFQGPIRANSQTGQSYFTLRAKASEVK